MRNFEGLTTTLLFCLIGSFFISSGAFASSDLAGKMAGRYRAGAGCQITNGYGKPYSEFSVRRGLPDAPDSDREFLGVFGKTAPRTPWWGDRRSFVKLDEIGEVTRISNGGDAYNRLFRQTASGYEILIQRCAFGFCHSWIKEGAMTLLPNGNLRIELNGDHQEANGQGVCTLVRLTR